MKQNNWVWMPHAGHFILGHKCQFKLNTYVGGYIVSTVGELWNERKVREIHAEVHDKNWLMKNIQLKGDDFDNSYFKRFEFEEIGMKRTYETMVFKAKKSKNKCCPFEIILSEEVDFRGYNKPEDAFKGHLKLCEKWSKKKFKKLS